MLSSSTSNTAAAAAGAGAGADAPTETNTSDPITVGPAAEQRVSLQILGIQLKSFRNDFLSKTHMFNQARPEGPYQLNLPDSQTAAVDEKQTATTDGDYQLVSRDVSGKTFKTANEQILNIRMNAMQKIKLLREQITYLQKLQSLMLREALIDIQILFAKRCCELASAHLTLINDVNVALDAWEIVLMHNHPELAKFPVKIDRLLYQDCHESLDAVYSDVYEMLGDFPKIKFYGAPLQKDVCTQVTPLPEHTPPEMHSAAVQIGDAIDQDDDSVESLSPSTRRFARLESSVQQNLGQKEYGSASSSQRVNTRASSVTVTHLDLNEASDFTPEFYPPPVSPALLPPSDARLAAPKTPVSSPDDEPRIYPARPAAADASHLSAEDAGNNDLLDSTVFAPKQPLHAISAPIPIPARARPLEVGYGRLFIRTNWAQAAAETPSGSHHTLKKSKSYEPNWWAAKRKAGIIQPADAPVLNPPTIIARRNSIS